MKELRWQNVDTNKLNTLYVAYRSDCIAQSCVRAIENTLLSSGILYTDKTYSKVASQSFQNHIDQHFVRFVREALVQLGIAGFCAFVINDDKPKCIPFGAINVRWALDEDSWEIQYGGFASGEDKPRDDIFFVVDGGVDANGDILSSMASYMRSRMLSDMFMRNAITADTYNARPPIYTTYATDAVFDEREIHDVGEVDGYAASLMKQNMAQRQRLVVGSHEFNERLVNALNGAVTQGSKQERVDPYTKLPHFDADSATIAQAVIPLPPDTRVAGAPRATARSDVLQFVSHFETLCCVSFGVNPEGLGLQRSSFPRSGLAMHEANAQTMATAARYAKLFEPVLVRIYQAVWGDQDMRDDITDADEDKVDVAALFPSILPANIIHQLYNTKILSHEAYVSYLSMAINMPVSSFENDHRFDAPQQGQGKPIST